MYKLMLQCRSESQSKTLSICHLAGRVVGKGRATLLFHARVFLSVKLEFDDYV